MYSSVQDQQDWYNNTGDYTVDYNDPNDPYGVSDGYDYNLDMWADDDGYQDAFDTYQSTGEGGGGYQGGMTHQQAEDVF